MAKINKFLVSNSLPKLSQTFINLYFNFFQKFVAIQNFPNWQNNEKKSGHTKLKNNSLRRDGTS